MGPPTRTYDAPERSRPWRRSPPSVCWRTASPWPCPRRSPFSPRSRRPSSSSTVSRPRRCRRRPRGKRHLRRASATGNAAGTGSCRTTGASPAGRGWRWTASSMVRNREEPRRPPRTVAPPARVWDRVPRRGGAVDSRRARGDRIRGRPRPGRAVGGLPVPRRRVGLGAARPRRAGGPLPERGGSEGTLRAQDHARSGLTRATLRGAIYGPVYSPGDVAAAAGEELRAGTRLVCAYYPGLDFTGHLRGPASDAWALELGHVDRIASDLADRLPPGSAMIGTGDHGMVEVLEEQKIDLAYHPELTEGVRLIAGEPRARFVYSRPGAERDVLAAWHGTLGDRMWVVSRGE